MLCSQPVPHSVGCGFQEVVSDFHAAEFYFEVAETVLQNVLCDLQGAALVNIDLALYIKINEALDTMLEYRI